MIEDDKHTYRRTVNRIATQRRRCTSHCKVFGCTQSLGRVVRDRQTKHSYRWDDVKLVITSFRELLQQPPALKKARGG